MSQQCVHMVGLAPVVATLDVCEACVREGSTWFHLRQCLVCGQTLCCDNSPKQHMSHHYRSDGHAVMRAASPGEDWVWCYADDAMIRETPGGWSAYDPFIVNGIDVAAHHLASGGSLRPAPDFMTDDGLPIGDWFAYVRELHDAGDLDPIDVAAIEAIPGFAW